MNLHTDLKGTEKVTEVKNAVMKRPLISVCVIAYNHEKYIRKCLDSILGQKTSYSYEILLGEDDSSDKTRQICREYAEKHPDKIRLFLHDRSNVMKIGGVPTGRYNFLYNIHKARGRYIALCEGDDYWTDENKLHKQVRMLEDDKSLMVCFGRTKVVFEDNEHEPAVWPTNITKESLTVENLVKENYIPTNTVVYRKQKYDNIVPDTMPGDWYLHLYHAQYGGIGFIDEVVSVYRRHSGGLWWDSHSNPTEHFNRNGARMLSMLGEVLNIYKKDEAVTKQVYQTATNLLVQMTQFLKKPNMQVVVEEHSVFATESVRQLGHTVEQQQEILKTSQDRIRALENEVREMKLLNRALEDKALYLQNELEGLHSAPVVGKTIKAARLKAKIVEDVRLNNGAAIRRKVYGKTVQKPYQKVRGAYVQKRLKYVLVKNTKAQKNKPLVSVVIPYFNRHETILETLDSVFLQTYQYFEVIVVDDGSTQKASKDMLMKIAKHPTKPHVIKQENLGVAAARNNGISQAKGRYIVCLDSDDIIKPLYIEKCLAVLESDPDVSLVTTGIEAFGVSHWTHIHKPYDPLQLFLVNLAGTASMYRKQAWVDAGGYKSDLGYEDWDLWLSMAEKGHFGRRIPELLFRYRTATESRFIEDRSAHPENIKKIQSLHPQYRKNIKALMKERRYLKQVIDPKTAFINMDKPKHYKRAQSNKPHAIIIQPWMTFGGAETVTLNFAKELTATYELTFITGLASAHEWEYRFAEISERIYHMPHLFDSPAVFLEFISNYIDVHDVTILHLVHTNFAHNMLSELKKRHPKLKIILTMFNARVDHFPTIVDHHMHIDMLTSDNSPVAREYKKLGVQKNKIRVLPNGIDSTTTFNPDNYDRDELRADLGIKEGRIAIFFIGRLSPEKNPDVFVDVARYFSSKKQYQSLRFFIVGDGPMKEQIVQSIKGVKNIKHLGYRSDIAQMLAASDAFVLPSSIEGFPLSILEAMAMDNVCIASNVGAIPDIIEEGKNGLVVAPGSVNDIVDSLIFIHSNLNTLERMQQQSRSSVTKLYSSEILGENYRKLYKDVSS